MSIRHIALWSAVCALSLLLAAPAQAAPATAQKQVAAAPAPKAAPARANPVAESSEVVHERLKMFAAEHLTRANTTLRPNRANPEMRKEGKLVILRFLEVDATTLQTELYPSDSPGCLYVGHIVYIERILESEGQSRVEAQKSEPKVVKLRRIRELTRYNDGKWYY